MKVFVIYLKKELLVMQLFSGLIGWIELLNGQCWNSGYIYKFNVYEFVQMKGGFVLCFLMIKICCLLGMVGGCYGN